MRFVSMRDLREKSSAIWKDLRKDQELILTRNGRPYAILCPVDENDLEEELTAIRRARALKLVESLQRESVKRGTDNITMEEIDEEIRKARRERSR